MKYYAKDQFNILYEDNHLLVVEKPAGILTQPDPQNAHLSVEKLAKEFLAKRDHKNSVFLHVVHRLDKDVSGIVLFAKSSKALSRLNEQMRKQKIKRHYLACVEGSLLNSKGALEHYLLHSSHRAVISSASNKQAKRALLDYCVIGSKEHCSLVSITLRTGRYHQIRAQLSAIGHPIVGDHKYGSKTKEIKKIKNSNNRVMLHQYHLAWTHPVKNIPMSVFLIPKQWLL